MKFKRIEDEKPVAYQSGDWDGLKTGPLLVEDSSGEYYVSEMYEGTLDGASFCEFYDKDGFEIHDVVRWTKIEG